MGTSCLDKRQSAWLKMLHMIGGQVVKSAAATLRQGVIGVVLFAKGFCSPWTPSAEPSTQPKAPQLGAMATFVECKRRGSEVHRQLGSDTRPVIANAAQVRTCSLNLANPFNLEQRPVVDFVAKSNLCSADGRVVVGLKGIV